MLITLHLQGFKGIDRRQRVDLAPLTLLVGHDGAGKSVILDAILYLRELLDHGNADIDRTEIGGDVIELGGFARLVHDHDTTRAIVLRAELTTPGGLERFGRAGIRFPFPDLDDQIESAWLELTVRMRTTPTFHGPLVDRVTIGVGPSPEPLVWLETGASLHETEPLYARVNLGHPLLAHAALEVAEAWASIAVPAAVPRPAHDHEAPRAGVSPREPLGLHDHRPLPVFAMARSRRSALPPSGERLHVLAGGPAQADETIVHEVRSFLEMVVLGISTQLAATLRDALYVGSLRTIPPRSFLYECTGRTSSWADGLAAWDRLLTDRSTLVQRTNRWLQRLGTSCRVVVQSLLEAPPELRSHDTAPPTARLLRLDANSGSLVLPSEVGAGLVQLLPVVVTTLEARAGISLVELPELHVHPAIQVGLGDLFIEAATRDQGRRTMLVETHSEHLILRLLRRIRQTSEGELPAGSPAFSPEQLSVLHVASHPDGIRIRRLQVDEHGELRDRWPKGLFAERRAELL
jgi:AAA domain